MSLIGQWSGLEKEGVPAEVGQRHDVLLNIVVQDVGLLWSAAAQQLAGYGLGQEDIEACIGPRADISVGDCLRTLLAPFEVEGCGVQDVAIAAKPNPLENLDVPELRNLMTELSQSVEASARHLLWASNHQA